MKAKWLIIGLVLMLLSIQGAIAAYQQTIPYYPTGVLGAPYTIYGNGTMTSAGLNWTQLFDGKRGQGLNFDGDGSWSTNVPEVHVTLDLGSGNTSVVKAYNITISLYNGSRNFDPVSTKIYGSNDNSTFTLLHWANTSTYVNGERARQFNFTNTVAYRWYRLGIWSTTANASSPFFSEWTILNEDTPADANKYLTVAVNDTRQTTSLASYTVTYNTTNSSDPGPFTIAVTNTSWPLTNYTGTLNLSFTNINGSTYFNTSITNYAFTGLATAYGLTWQNYLNLSINNSVNNSKINRFCINVTNTTDNLISCTARESVVFYNLINTLTITWHSFNQSNFAPTPRKTINGTSYQISNDEATLNQWCIEQYGGTYLSITNTSTLADIAYYNGTAWYFEEPFDFLPVVNTITCYGGNNSQYFTKAMTIASFNTTQNLTNTTYQALINLSAYKLYLNTSIASFNGTNDQVTNTTSTSSLTLPANVGSNNVKVDVANNYSVNGTCTITTALSTEYCNATGVYDNRYTFGANNGTGLMSFTVNASNTTLGGTLQTISTTNGSVVFSLLQGYWYLFYANAPGYSVVNVSLPTNASTHSYNFSVLSYNTFEIRFYNETTDQLLNNTSVTVQLISDTYAVNYTTSTGNLTILALTPEEYTIRYWNNPDVPREYYVTLSNQSYNNLSLYIVDEEISSLYLPVIYNQYTRPVSAATIQLMRYFLTSNSYKVVEMSKTDTNGQAVLRVVPNIINYKLLVCSGTICTTTSPTKFTATTNAYTLSFSQNVLTSIVEMPSVQKSLYFNNATNTYVFTWTDTQNLVTEACLRVQKYNNSGMSIVNNECQETSTGSLIYTITDTSNNTRYAATATLETNTEFSTYTFGPITITFDSAAVTIFGLVGFIILLFILINLGFLANEQGSDYLIITSVLAIFLLGIIGIISYAWEAFVGMAIFAVLILMKTFR